MQLRQDIWMNINVLAYIYNKVTPGQISALVAVPPKDWLQLPEPTTQPPRPSVDCFVFVHRSHSPQQSPRRMLQSFEAQAAHAQPSRQCTSGLQWWFPPQPLRMHRDTDTMKVSSFVSKSCWPLTSLVFSFKGTTVFQGFQGSWKSFMVEINSKHESRGSFFTVSRDVSSTVCCVKQTSYRHIQVQTNIYTNTFDMHILSIYLHLYNFLTCIHI